MRTLVIGDIHGCLRAFDTLLEKVRPAHDDVVITLGDYVDRGPDSKGVVKRLLELKSSCQLINLKGNHEVMMLEARKSPNAYHNWCASGGKKTIESYDADPKWDSFRLRIPAKHWQFIDEALPYFETETHFFVHANACSDIPLADQPDFMLFWEQIHDSRPHESGKIMICGHTAQRSGKPLVFDHAVCIDTWVYGDGWLTSLNVATGMYVQANEKGQTRIGWLDNPPDDWIEED